ncbi:MAG: hypothetical protein GIS02_02985 [Methanosarcinales archaeon]|uniref:Uncharacterized protein n=1 Tax=Candidatus Ethanoperedens thermophilum TaxID=2766897 RepID=A0A848DBA2_9EURY|nr:hypothetical protein [Candidatus Ethanoperedens thermophilum]
MIYESFYWKKELYDCFRSLAKFRQLRRITELSCVKIEKALMIGAYIVRKLNEAEKIPPDFLKQKVTVSKYKNKKNLIDHMNWHRFESNYNLEKYTKEEKDWRYLINQIIHSFSFSFSYDDNGKLDGFFVNSDRSKDKSLYFVSIENILCLFLKISEGDITSSHSQRKIINEKNGTQKIGPMKIKHAFYSYPNNIDINSLVIISMNGDIYKRVVN